MTIDDRNTSNAERAYDVQLFLVLDDGSGEASFFALARDEEHAKELARPALVGDGEEEDLRVVSAETTNNQRTRHLLTFWGVVAQQALTTHHPRVVMDELNSLEVLHWAIADLEEIAWKRRTGTQSARSCALHADCNAADAEAPSKSSVLHSTERSTSEGER